MFYHTYILTKRGPFAKIWLAAHWDKKLSKNDVKLIDLNSAVLNIIEPVVPISLRTSGELMLGVVRVYGHKVRILLKESQDATHEVSRGREAHTSHHATTKGKNTVTSEAISAVTNTEPIDKHVAAGKGFDAEFAAIEDIVMNTSGQKDAAKPFESEQAMINKWFHTGSGAMTGAGQYNPADTFLDFRREINREFFPNREDSMSISDKSKHSNSSGSSIEELRRSTALPPSAEKRRFHIDIGLPVNETDELPEIPEMTMDTSFPHGDLLDVPADEFPHQNVEPPRKKRAVLKESLVDSGETVISSEVYRKHMRDRSDLLCDFYRQSAAAFPGEAQISVDSTAILGEQSQWNTFAEFFAAQLKAKTIDLRTAGGALTAEMDTHAPPEEEPLPEFGANFSPMRPSGMTDPEFALEAVPYHGQVPEISSAALLESVKSAAEESGAVLFHDLMHKTTKSVVARRFGDLLALASRGDVRVEQTAPFAAIRVTV